MNDKLNIEDLFKSKLEELEYTPSPRVWKQTSRTLRRDAFLRFNPERINIFYVAGIVLVAVVTTIVLTGKVSGIREQVTGSREQVTGSRDQVSGVRDQRAGDREQGAGGSGIKVEAIAGQQASDHAEESKMNNPRLQDESPKPQAATKKASEKEETSSGLSANTLYEAESSESDASPSVSTFIAYFTPSLYEGCVPLEVRFINSSINATAYNWNFGPNESSYTLKSQPSSLNPSIRFVEPGTYTVTLTASNSDGTKLSHSEQITVHPKPTADFEIAEDHIYNYSSGATEYKWFTSENPHKNLKALSSDFQPLIEATSYLTPHTSHLTLVSYNNFGCSDTATLKIPDLPEAALRFPTAFSPNPNGSNGGYYNSNEPGNQVFYPKYSEKPTTYNLQIFNKAGELIFESKEIEIGWDGYYKEAPAAQGVYIYQCTGTWKNGEPYNYRGDITILWTQN